MNKKTKNEDLGRLDVISFQKAKKIPIIIILDDIRSLNNIGSFFRTADAFRIQEILLCGICAQPPNKDIRKTALGATESVAWRYFESVDQAILDLKTKGFKVISIEQSEHAVSLDKFQPDPDDNYALIFGNEVRGVAQSAVDQSDMCIEIPQFGTKHSFNVSVSCGIVLWDIVSKMGATSDL